MTTFANVHLSLFFNLLLAALSLALLLIGFTVCMKDQVESNPRFLPFGFSLKARNNVNQNRRD